MRYLIIGLFVIASTLSFSQNAVLRGFIYDKESGEPMIYTTVYFKGKGIGATTDGNGFFNISKIPPGTYNLMVTSIGYDTISEFISLKEGDFVTKKLFIGKGTIELKTVDISAQKEESKTDVQISVVKISPKEISQIPSVGGTPDLAQYLAVLPGVVFTGDQGGQLYIRGGSPIQNKVLLDGMIVYNPFHSIGLFSVFDMDIIRNAEVYTGGFNAQYGGRISSIMDITTRDGNKKRLAGLIGASPFGARAILEGPLRFSKKKLDKNGNTINSLGSSSFLLSAKNSYLAQTSKSLYSYADKDGLPFNYRDIYGKLSFNSENGSKLNAFGFNFKDDVNYQNISKFKWNANGFGTNFVLIPGSTSMLFEGNIAYSDYKVSLTEEDGLPRTSQIKGTNIGFSFTNFYGKNSLIYGFEVLGFKTDFNFYNAVARHIVQIDNTVEAAAYVKYKIVKERFVIEPGFRGHYYASLSNFSPEPRIGMKFNITDNFRLKASGGLYSQNLIAANSDRDVVNLFYGFLSGPENLQDEFDGQPVKHKLQKAIHGIFGFEYDIKSLIFFNIEGYIKQFTQLTNLNRNKIFDESSDKPDYLKNDFIIENGQAKGIDFSVKYEVQKFYLWAVYSLGFVNKYDGIINYVPHYDRRHNVNIVGVYRFGKRNSWEFDARWNLGSGFPFTQTQGFAPTLDFGDGANSDFISENPNMTVQYAEYNKARMPYYHRLDVSLKKTMILSKNSKLEFNAGVTNAYNRKNVFYISRITQKVVYQLPAMPSIGLTLTF